MKWLSSKSLKVIELTISLVKLPRFSEKPTATSASTADAAENTSNA